MIMKRFLLKKTYLTLVLILIFAFGYAQQGGVANNYTCAEAAPVCPDNNFGVNIPNVLDVPDAEAGPDYGCLGGQPSPMWFYMRVATSGNAMFDLTQYSEPDGQGTGLDVDFILWGPFESQEACDQLTHDKIVDCSFDGRPYEVIDFYTDNPDANSGPDGPFNPGYVNAGEYYILLVTNWNDVNGNGDPGFVNLLPRYPEMTATFDCSILGPTYEFCDYDGDGVETVYLDNYISEINGGEDTIIVTFHETSYNAYNYVDPLTSEQILTTDPLTVYARKEDLITNQVEVVVISFTLIPEPELQEDTLQFCDNNADGVELFDLTAANVIVEGQETEITLTYYTSQEDADAAENAIDDPTYYESGNDVIYVRGDVGDCYATTTITLILIDTIELAATEDAVCDEDGVYTFNLNDYTDEILNGNNGTILFYENESDAIAGNGNYITNPESYETGTVVLYAYVAGDGDCNATTTLTLTVDEAPVLNEVENPYSFCDNQDDGTETIDLSIALDDLVDDTTGLIFEYYLTEEDAENGNTANAISNPTSYELTGTTVVYVRAIIGDCYDVEMITFELSDGISVTNDILYDCDTGTGNGTFDLTSAEIANEGTLTYHISQEDADSGDNPIPNPDNYLSSVPAMVYVRIESGDCMNTAEISLAYYTPPTIDIPEEVSICSGYSEPVDAGAGFVFYVWSTDETTQVIEVNELGSYWVDVTDANGCTYRHEFEVISGIAPVITNVNIGQDSFEVMAEGGVQPYQYSIGGFLYQDLNIFSNLNPGVYNVYVRGEDGCVSSVQVTVVFEWPTVFTPNGDGFNDEFVIPNLDVYPGSHIRIFDRYGALIYESDIDSNQVWDGRDMSGKKVSSQDYWYILDVSDGRRFDGHITVKNRTEKGN